MIARVVSEVIDAIGGYGLLHDDPEPCRDRQGFNRVAVEIPLTPRIFDQLMNGSTGYRAHYFAGSESGENFNKCLVDAIASPIINACHLYEDKFDENFCRNSLLGPFAKLWFPKSLTDPGSEARLARFDEEIRVSRWLAYWQTRARPRKGLLAPAPENTSVVLNGTFVDAAGESYEQKPGRSKQLFESGWT